VLGPCGRTAKAKRQSKVPGAQRERTSESRLGAIIQAKPGRGHGYQRQDIRIASTSGCERIEFCRCI
jgi:hypothetical protein